MNTDCTTTSTASITGYGAANDNPTRSLFCWPTNSRTEYNRWTRWKLQKDRRALEGNFAFATRIQRKIGRCSVGKGIIPTAATSDTEWNALADAYLETIFSNPAAYSIDASVDFWGDQNRVAEELGAGDGEYFSAFVEFEDNLLIQPIDVFEVGTPAFGIGDRTKVGRCEDGVYINEYLRPTGISVRELPECGEYSYGAKERKVPSGQYIHIFRRRRSKQFRGLPPLYSGLNDGHDAMDRMALEKATEKLHSVLGVALTDGEGGGTTAGITGNVTRLLGSDGKPIQVNENFPQGAATVRVPKGGKAELLSSNRPSPEYLAGIKFYCQLFALGVDLPFGVMFEAMGGGPATNAEMEDAQSTFEMIQDTVVWRHSHPIRTRLLAHAIENGLLRRCLDPYFWTATWRGPAKITANTSRTAKANMDLVDKGMLSIPSFHDAQANVWQREQDRQIEWIKRAKEKCKEAGVEYAELRAATPGSQPMQPGKPNDNTPTDE